MTKRGNTDGLLDVVTIRTGGRRSPLSPQGTLFGGDVDDPSLPPRTRAECPDTSKRACIHTRCRHHLDALDERAGQPHDGKRAPPLIRRRHEEQIDPSLPVRPSCALDQVQDGKGHVASEGVEVTTKAIGQMLGVSQRRIQQLEERALDKLWFARQIGELVEDWAELKLYPRGGTVEMRWGVGEQDGHQVPRVESKKLYVMMVVDLSRFDRPVETRAKVKPAGHGVMARKKETR